MLRTPGTAPELSPHDAGRRPETGPSLGRPGVGDLLTRRRAVDFGHANSARCRRA